MEVAEAIDSRPPLAALSPCQQNTDAGDEDFSKLTSSQFGISSDSFLPSSKIIDKSRLAQLKARRRSSIGVRGSPETNSLICFRAKQAAKTPPRTPQLLQGSPFLSRCDSLKKKLAVFQCLMEEEEEGKGESRKNEENESVESTLAKESQNGKEHMLTMQSSPSSITPPPSKKRCRVPQVGCEDKITASSLQYPTLTMQPEQWVRCSESISLVSDSKNELLSLPMLSNAEIKATDENMVVSICKKKRVRFGAPLSPEFFDKTLPPSTPLQKGGTPMCPPSSTGTKRSLLKTPQRCEPPLPQPDFNSPQNNGASPVLVIDRCSTGLVYSDDVFEEIEKISFPNMDEESPSNKPSECCKDIFCDEDSRLPLAKDAEVMNAAFQEDADVPSDSQTEEKLPSQTGDQPLALSTADADLESVSVASTKPTRSRSKKRKQPGDSEPEKRRSTRTAATSASGKMTKSSGLKRRFGNKDVNRSLYGKRDYASKNPLLSPIFETTSTSFNSTPIQTQSGKLTDGKQDCNQMDTVPHSKTVHTMVSLETAALSEGTLVNENEQNMTCLEHSASTKGPTCRRETGLKVHKSKRNSERPAHQRRRSGTIKRNGLSDPAIDSTTESEVEMGDYNVESQESTVAASLDLMNQDNPDGTALHQAEHCEKEEAKILVSFDTPTMVPNADHVTTERSEQKMPRHGYVQKTLKSPCVKVDVLVAEVDMNGQYEKVDQTESSECKTGPIEPGLAPWQQIDFNIDDILKPVARSRGSVRRSLRNRRSVDLQAVGLAWVDHTSPELSKATRRRTRGRLSGVSEPLVIQASEEPMPNLGE
ncbi:cell division cycle-associated protein 2-like [Xyrauchen texanus]|uniref:cell division cycle-associated protein 2-like n=1 Tax=Xyrauchen texanus TaxID=154827 RepID=UPI002241C160|nr:cell division cycle-associated protein 2-like [Xyrauchen texanus]